MPNRRVHILENTYVTMCESRVLHGAGIWEIVDGVWGHFCKKVLRIPRNAANDTAKSEHGRDSKR
jgi:hypothetical protein